MISAAQYRENNLNTNVGFYSHFYSTFFVVVFCLRCVNVVKSCWTGHWYSARAEKCCHLHRPSEGLSSRCGCSLLCCAVLCCAVLGRTNHLARLLKRSFYWATQSGRPALGALPRKHSCEGGSPYPARWLKGASIITVQRSPCHLPFLLLFLLLPSPPCLILAPARFLFSSSCSLPLLQPRRLPSGGRELRRKVAFCCWPCSTQISCDRFLLQCLPAWKRRQT